MISTYTKEEEVIQEIMYDTYLQCQEIGLSLPDYDLERFGIRNWYASGIFTTDTVSEHNNEILRVLDGDGTKEQKRKMGAIFMDSYSRLYNFASLLPHGNTSLIAKDFLEIQNNERLIASSAIYWQTEDFKDLKGTYSVLKDVMINDISPINKIRQMYLGKTLKKDQFEMQFAPRGPVSNNNAHIYSYPVRASYAIGPSSIQDIAVDSRVAGNAIASVHRDTGQAEGLSKRMRTLAAKKIHLLDDCKTTDGLDMIVMGEGTIKGAHYKGDLVFMEGLYFYRFDPIKNKFSTNIEKITPSVIKAKELIGKRIKLRSQLTCAANSESVCKVCAGGSSELRVQGKNFGIANSARYLDAWNQATLSPKHRVAAAALQLISLPDELSTEYTLGKDNRSLFSNITSFSVPNPSPLDKPFGMYISHLYVPSITRMIQIDNSGSKLTLVINKKFHEFLQTAPHTTTKQATTFDISSWDINHSIGALQESTVNFTVVLNRFKTFFEGQFAGTLEEYWSEYRQINTVISVNWSSIMTVAACRLSTLAGLQVQGRGAVVLRLSDLLTSNLTSGLYMGNVHKVMREALDKTNGDHILDHLLAPDIANKNRIKKGDVKLIT